MTTVWSNLDFEYQLARAENHTPSKQVLAVCDAWSHLLRALPGLADARVLSRRDAPLEDTVCWGELRPGTDRDLMARANAKTTSHELELELGCALPGARVVRTLEALERAVDETPHRWVAKHPLGVSARERVLGHAGELDDAARSRAARLLSATPLVFEPWVEQRTERSWHVDVTGAGEVDFVGACSILTDATGTPRGHIVSPEHAAPAREVLDAARAIGALGYTGPLGVDAMEGWLGERRVERPITEINARYTFGRLALALARHHAPAGWWLAWWHPPRRASRPEVSLELSGALDAPAIARLPEHVDPGGRSGTLALVAPSAKALDALARAHALETIVSS